MTLSAAYIVFQIFRVFEILIILRVVMSWTAARITPDGFVKFVTEVTDPILIPFRKIFSASGMGIDLSPMIALFLLHIIRGFVISVIA